MISESDYKYILSKLEDNLEFNYNILNNIEEASSIINDLDSELSNKAIQDELVNIINNTYNLVILDSDKINSLDNMFIKNLQNHIKNRYGNIDDFYSEYSISPSFNFLNSSEKVGF
jgi:hypothetical protein